MHLRHLTLRGFRNLADAELQLPEDGVAIVGPNAQGKTNLLEAIHYLEIFRSFRGARDDQLVRFGGEFFRLAGELGVGSPDERAPRVTAAYHVGSRTKKVTLDGEAVSRLGEAIGRIGAVLFTPDDVRLISDGPDERRRFLDIVLSLNIPDYLESLQTFRHALSQRNAALRDRASDEAVSAWNPALVRSGADVTWSRASWLRELSDHFGDRYAEISGGSRARIDYESSIPGADEVSTVAEVQVAYRTALSTSAAQEERQRTTVIGPHRDELRMFHLDGEKPLDLRQFGSGGQRRTAALTLRLLEVETVRRRRNREPVLLLDDVFAELDEARSERVLEVMNRVVRGQVLLTAPKASDVRLRGDTLGRWTIENGRIQT